MINVIKKSMLVFGIMAFFGASQGLARFVNPSPDSGNASERFSFSSWNWSAVKSFFVKQAETKIKPSSDNETVKSTPISNTTLQKATKTLKSLQIPRVSVPGIPFEDRNLILGHNDVPVFEFKKFKARTQASRVKKTPLLNVGTEPILGKIGIEDMIIDSLPVVRSDGITPLSKPNLLTNSEFEAALGSVIKPAQNVENLEIPFLEPEHKVTAEKLAKIVYTLIPGNTYKDLLVSHFAEEDLKLLRGLILFEKKDQCHIASGIFSDLIQNSNSEEIKLKSHFLLGLCLHEMNLPTEAIYHLKKVIKTGDSRYVTESVKALIEEVPIEYESEVVEAFLTIKSENLLPESLVQDIGLLKAKYYLKKGQPQKALELAIKVPMKHPKYYKAQYLASVAEYELEKLDSAIDRQKTLAAELMKRGNNKDVLALVQINLGRLAFQKGRYKESLEAFQHVPKEHPLWLQALTEEAWTQLQSKDAAGAIGNMHSIQSPYFDGVFKPEGYIVRAIGYINICQYADASRSLAIFEHKYLPWYEKLKAYLKKDPDPYQSVVTHLQNRSSSDMDGLPSQIVREAARQKDFLNIQEGVNSLIDENGGYNFVRGLIEKDKKNLLARRNATIAKVGALKARISKARTTPDAMKDFNAWRFELANYEEFLSVYEFKVMTLKEGSEGFQRMIPEAQARIAEEKTQLRHAAGRALKNHFLRMEKDLKANFENNELLKYEIYAGSGENLRYKVAGGKTGGTTASAVDRHPSGEKWDFAGEFWEDEIGNYRSSLKNNCQTLTSQAGKESK